MHVQIVLFDGFDLLDALAPYEVFTAAEMLSGGAITVQLVSAEGIRNVSSGTNGLQIATSGMIDSGKSSIILVPGASGSMVGDGPDSVVSLLQRASETQLTTLVREAFGKPGITIATVCGGSLLLAMSGMLEGRHAVTHHQGMDALSATGAIPVKARVVDDGDLVTGGGVTSGLDTALYLIERELGPRMAHAVEQLFEYERRGTVWQARGLAPIAEVSPSSPESDLSPQISRLEEATDGDEPNFEGVWSVVIATPIGKMQATLIISKVNGQVRGIAEQAGEVVDFMEPVIQDNQLSWLLRVTKPMRLNLRFQVHVHGNQMMGTAKAGMLPASKVTGERLENERRAKQPYAGLNVNNQR
ncbi:DJ-1/PfpI family protein [Paenibacillus sp. FSL H8-0034]|uniref:DJ-1/PfpI family protein n=1 Tax=Paenibacillus sp. FSL H8-0034 TaxID=2954671 RepID=UPI0030F81169